MAAVFLGPALIFTLEPMVGKQVLPRFGGVPAVWNTCLLFFQVMLLAGYAYAHYGLRRLGRRRHALLHHGLIAVSVIVVVAVPPHGMPDPPASGSPVGWLLLTLLRTVGLPFFVLSATAPLVQTWLAGTRHPAGRDPYFLYAASNLGSVTGLMLYPLLLEPLAGLRVQAYGWAAGYALFGALLTVLAWRAHRPAAAIDEAEGEVAAAPSEAVSATTALRWVGIAFLPSALLLTVTDYVTTDIAPMPMLWLAPLALYLTTFVLAFGARVGRTATAFRVVQPAVTLILATAVLGGYSKLWLLPLHLFGLTLAAYLAHARLAVERPDASRLTAFYLWISVGGVLGGVFGAILAPLLLMPDIEYCLLLTAALLVPGRTAATEPPTLTRVLAGVAFFGIAGVVVMLLGEAGWGMLLTCGAATAILLRRLDASRPAVTLVVAIGLTIFALAVQPVATLARERNFFGTLRVSHSAGAHSLVHGRTVHGVQLTAPHELTTPTTYYAQAGPLGDVFRILMPDVRDRRVASLGLGVGTIACYAQPDDEWDLFEINPAVVRIATDPRLFVFVPHCTPDARIIVGDARRALQDMPHAKYDLIVLDAFTSDAIPAHLLTREAFTLYLEHLRPGGLLAVHISNRYLDLTPVLAANAAALGATALIRNDNVHHDDPTQAIRRTPSTWVVLAADSQRLQPLERLDGWFTLAARRGFRPWTDDFASLLPVIRLFRGVSVPGQ